ncbi:hypothetical protein I4U23_021844 [Adineta vaga]|nr:hypothetical protein I4U23_021844 [Adineta vaga]
MGGTSLGLIRVLTVIRAEISPEVDVNLLIAHPTIGRLARALESLASDREEKPMEIEIEQGVVDHEQPRPNLYVEFISIVLLACQWIYPIWKVFQYENMLTVIDDRIYSWDYYRWWFLERLWSVNNSYWLHHLLGTPFYNWYLRVCGAKIGRHTQIYTTMIDTPWLLEVGESTFIGDETLLSSLTYDLAIYKLDAISIGSYLFSYDEISIICLRCLGAEIEDDVKLAEVYFLLHFPTNLLKLERSVTIFSRVKLVSFETTDFGDCLVDRISLGSGTNLGNECTLMPGTYLKANTMVGVLTLITRESYCSTSGAVLLGIPGRQMPFLMPDKVTSAQHAPSTGQRTKTKFTFSEMITSTFILIAHLFDDFYVFIAPFLARTQFLVMYFRLLGAQIGCDVIISDVYALVDSQFVTIGDHVRLSMGSIIQCHTFEQRIYELAPVTVKNSTIITSACFLLSGSTLHGQNRLFPYTLIMKNEQLPFNTHWSGVPARRIRQTSFH